MKQRFSLILFLGFSILSLLACQAVTGLTATPTAEPTSTRPPATQTAIPTRQPSATPASSPTPLPTEPPTATLRPTFTPMPTATALPRGFILKEAGAFSLQAVNGYETVQEEASFVFIANQSKGIGFLVGSEPGTSLEDFESATLEAFELAGNNPVKTSEITLATGETLKRKHFLLEEEGLEIQMVFAAKGTWNYFILAFSDPDNLEVNASEILRLFEGVSLLSGGGTIYGMNRTNTVVVMGGDPDPEDLDPALTTSGAGGYTGMLFSGLVRLSPSLQVELDLAENFTISPDGTEYTFVLREDLVFQNGKPLTAYDVQYSWERAADPALNSTVSGTYLGDILGFNDKLAGKADTIAGLKVLDARTLVVTLDAPKMYFLAKLTYPTSYVVDQENVEADPEGWMYSPNASGPFGLKQYTEQDVVVFSRNAAYHTPSKIDGVVYLLFRGGSRISFFEAGEIDTTGLAPQDAKIIQDDPENPLREQLLSTTSMCTSYVTLNNQEPPMDDPNLRKAMALALDYDRLLEISSEGLEPRANSILPPGLPGHNPALLLPGYNPQAAKDALAASGVGSEPIELTFTVAGYAENTNPYLDAIVAMWRDTLGIEIVLQYVDPRRIPESEREAFGHIFFFGWCADYPDPENFLDILFHSQSDFNVSKYSNPAYDRLVEEARAELDVTQRLELYKRAERMILDDFGVIPLEHGLTYVLVAERIQNYTHTAITVPQMHRIEIAP